MIIRTISQLPKVNQSDGIPDESLIEMSISKNGTDGQNFISKACRYGILRTKISEQTISDIKATYKLADGMNLTDIKSKVDKLMNGTSIDSSGNKTCSKILKATNNINNTYPTPQNYEANKNNIATIQALYQAVNGSSIRVGENSYIYDIQFRFNQQQDKNIGKLTYAEHNGQFVEGNDVTTPSAGMLVLYGWLADNGTIDTAKCWVALQGYIKNEWRTLQMQPWILGSRHQNMQYVGFNTLVAKGLKLRIQTGFDIDYNSSAYQMVDNTLVNNTNVYLQTNIGPSFIGSLYC